VEPLKVIREYHESGSKELGLQNPMKKKRLSFYNTSIILKTLSPEEKRSNKGKKNLSVDSYPALVTCHFFAPL
jgi:hypothetical protein